MTKGSREVPGDKPQHRYLLPMSPWPCWSPWLVLVVGVLLGPFFAASPVFFAAVTLVYVLTSCLIEG